MWWHSPRTWNVEEGESSSVIAIDSHCLERFFFPFPFPSLFSFYLVVWGRSYCVLHAILQLLYGVIVYAWAHRILILEPILEISCCQLFCEWGAPYTFNLDSVTHFTVSEDFTWLIVQCNNGLVWLLVKKTSVFSILWLSLLASCCLRVPCLFMRIAFD